MEIPKELTKLVVSFFSANFALMFAQGISGLIVARLIVPEDMGVFVSASIAITFIPILLMGVNNGLNRNLPYVIGLGKHEEAQEMRRSAVSYSFIVSIIVFISISIIGMYYYFSGNEILGLAFFSTAIIGALSPLTMMQEITYRTNNDFLKLSKIKFINVAISLSSILLVYYFEYYGLLVRSALIALSYFLLLFYMGSSLLEFEIKFEVIKKLVITGFPIAVVSYFYSIYVGLDKVLIVKYFDAAAMGNYVPAIQVGVALAVLPTSIFQIMYPKMAMKYGETHLLSSLWDLSFKPQIILAFGLIPVFGVAAYSVGPFVEEVLPEYVAGIPSARWMIVVMYFRCLGGPQDVLTIIGDLKPYAYVTVISGLIFWVSVFILNQFELGLIIVPIGLALSTFMFNLLISLYVLWLMRKEKRVNE